ncbi:hypothetical protein WCX18_06115 [Sulfurimonas sp. HSL1-2]|uniref:hypothetical protein n=1 Tax=Thiomicrolovo zhangzhouensis TaxID=3131933 RepID=UPI0031F8E05B
MQTIIRVYEHNKNLIEKFLFSTLNKQHVKGMSEASLQDLFGLFPSLEAIYGSDEAFIQNTPVYLRQGEDNSGRGGELSDLLGGQVFTDGRLITDPYISLTSGKLILTAVLETERGYDFYDFNLRALLERLALVAGHHRFSLFTRTIYLLMGAALIFFAIFSVLYGFGYFWWDLYTNANHFSLETIFKPVIAVTLGLAFFDLGKTIINHEVFRASETLEAFDAKSFVTFLTSIMIALLIEALLSAFKASLSNFSDLLYVAAMIASLALLFFVVTHFIRGVGVWKNPAPMQKSALQKK